jgi:hypothetical protein
MSGRLHQRRPTTSNNGYEELDACFVVRDHNGRALLLIGERERLRRPRAAPRVGSQNGTYLQEKAEEQVGWFTPNEADFAAFPLSRRVASRREGLCLSSHFLIHIKEPQAGSALCSRKCDGICGNVINLLCVDVTHSRRRESWQMSQS